MTFRLYCDNDDDGTGKKCRKESEVAIDKKTKVVYCGECGQPLKDQNAITIFAKNQMISLGQIRRDVKKKQSYSVKCVSCEREAQPSLSKNGKVLECSVCHKEMKNISAPFAQMLKENLRTLKRSE